jgi:hypothetical protein
VAEGFHDGEVSGPCPFSTIPWHLPYKLRKCKENMTVARLLAITHFLIFLYTHNIRALEMSSLNC